MAVKYTNNAERILSRDFYRTKLPVDYDPAIRIDFEFHATDK